MGVRMELVRSRVVQGAALLTASIGLTGCFAIMGIGNFKHFAGAEEQLKVARAYGLPMERSFVLDTNYRTLLDTMKSGSDELRKALWQPLQVRIYDREGGLLRVVRNCDVGGFPNLHWERTNVLDDLPAVRSSLIDSTITLAGDRSFLLPNGAQPEVTGKPWTIVVYWTVEMGRQSERLIRWAKERAAVHADDYDLWFVSADALYGP